MISRYIGSGPYCYSNSLAMVLADGTDPSLIEVLTGSPFGLQLLFGRRPMFDPLGWDPLIGLDAAIHLLGWTCERSDGGVGGEIGLALGRLRAAVAGGPVLVGPVEMGLLLHQPGSGAAIGADHYVLVVAFDGDIVTFHDPHGHPFATMPAEAFAASWRGDSIGYADAEFAMRTGFRRMRDVDPLDALCASLCEAAAWLDGRPEQAPPKSLGGGEAADALADLLETGLPDGEQDGLVWFGIRVGARRLADASYWLARIGRDAAADILQTQARLVGALQFPLVAGDTAVVIGLLRELAPTYRQLRLALGE